MRLATFLPLLALAACEMIPGTQAALQREARRKLTNELLDAPTARFQNVRMVIVPNGKATQLLCGEVNAKNALGAYAGFRRFMAERSTTFAVIDPNTGPGAQDDSQPFQETFDRYWHEWGCDRT